MRGRDRWSRYRCEPIVAEPEEPSQHTRLWRAVDADFDHMHVNADGSTTFVSRRGGRVRRRTVPAREVRP